MNQKNYSHLSDQDLLSRFYKEDDNEWLGILFQRYTLLLLGVCMKYLKNEEEARDAVQQIFLKALTELKKYPVSYFKSWIYMVAKNHCLMQLRHKSTHQAVEVTEKMYVPDESANLQHHVNKDKTLSLMESAMEELNDDQKLCVTLFYLEKKSYQQIAEQTGFNLMQVKSHIQNGKRNLKISMEKKLKNSI